jgi:hypothetical protein
VTVGDLAGLLAATGGVTTVTGFMWLVVWWARGNRADDEAIEQKLREQYDREAEAHRTERTRLQTVIDDERAKRRAGEDEAARRIREAEDDVARLRRMVRELGGDPG